jgi:hypothetical protein
MLRLDRDPKPGVERIKKHLRIYPLAQAVVDRARGRFAWRTPWMDWPA